MALVKVKPTSPGRRALVKVVNPRPAQGRAGRRARPKARSAARAATTTATSRRGTRAAATSSTTASSISSATRTASRPRSSGSNTTRTAARTSRCCCYADGERRYIIAPRGVAVGHAADERRRKRRSRPGNCLPLRNIPVGTTIHCVEMLPGKGAQIARSAGASVQLLAREGVYAQLRLRSGEIRKVHVDCRATIGEVGNEEHSLRSIGKAGANRWRGIRPTVRGVAMNPVDHPHGRRPTAAAAGTIRCRRGARRPRATRRGATSAPTA